MLRLRVPGGILTTASAARPCADRRGLGLRPRRSHHAQQSADPRVPAHATSSASSTVFSPSASRRAAPAPTTSATSPLRPSPASIPQELIDVAPLAEAMQAYITNSRDMYRAAAQVQHRLRQRRRHPARRRHQRHRLRRRTGQRRPQHPRGHLLPRPALRHHRPPPVCHATAASCCGPNRPSPLPPP